MRTISMNVEEYYEDMDIARCKAMEQALADIQLFLEKGQINSWGFSYLKEDNRVHKSLLSSYKDAHEKVMKAISDLKRSKE